MRVSPSLVIDRKENCDKMIAETVMDASFHGMNMSKLKRKFQVPLATSFPLRWVRCSHQEIELSRSLIPRLTPHKWRCIPIPKK